MLGPEVKHSRLMIDDADLQPEVVRFGERAGRPRGVPTLPAHHEVVIPSFPPTVCSHVQHASFMSPSSGGGATRDLDGAAEAGESRGGAKQC